MFNFQAPYIKDEALLSFAAKHDIKKIVTSDGTVKWYGCKRGLSYTTDKKCDWPDGIGAPPCDLWNLGEAVKFIMQACDEGGMACEYAAGNVLGKINILYWLIYIYWLRDAESYSGQGVRFVTIAPSLCTRCAPIKL